MSNTLSPWTAGAGGCHYPKQLLALSLLLSSHFSTFIHFPQKGEPKPMGLSLPGYTFVFVFLSQFTTAPTHSCTCFRFCALPHAVSPPFGKVSTTHSKSICLCYYCHTLSPYRFPYPKQQQNQSNTIRFSQKSQISPLFPR